jgi:hypothetical protein
MTSRRTDRDRIMRRALWTTAVMNLAGAAMFAFPDSVGRLGGMPPGPRVYTAFIAVLVALFGATYAWLARQPRIDRPLVAFSALGKTSFFVVVVACWLDGELPAQALGGATGDLVFATIFAWWLRGDGSAVAGRRAGATSDVTPLHAADRRR